MSLIPRGVWRYAVLIVLLFIIAALAARETISSITELVLDARTGKSVSDHLLDRVVTAPILALTMGFLFLAGALGVWAIRTTAQVEGRRRVGRFVDAMDYLRDGMLAVDRRGRITGSNPAARALGVVAGDSDTSLREAFPCLTEQDVASLVDPAAPQEVEAVLRGEDRIRALRFRSQPLEDLNLIIVSDVTGRRSEEMRSRQVARLQLIGRIARGVAHDFNNILCAISGYASLLERQKTGGLSAESLRSLMKESQRGAALATQLLDLSRTGVKGAPCERVSEHIERSVNLLKVGLSAEWQVIRDVEGAFPVIALTDAQLEQIVVNLGLLTADEQATPGFVHIRVRAPSSDEGWMDVGFEFAAVMLISAYGPDEGGRVASAGVGAELLTTADEAGVVQSVVRSVLEEVGGRLDILRVGGGKHSYRICLPKQVGDRGDATAVAGISEDLRMRIAGWKVLIAAPPRPHRVELEKHLERLGVAVEVAADIVAALQHVEADRALTAMVLDRPLLGEEGPALLKAIRKLRPRAGLVVLSDKPSDAREDLKSFTVFESSEASPEVVLKSLLRAEELCSGPRIIS